MVFKGPHYTNFKRPRSYSFVNKHTNLNYEVEENPNKFGGT